MKINEIINNFEILDDWHDKYAYLIELGNALPPFANEEMTNNNKVNGCVSQVWVVGEKNGDTFNFRGTSDAHIVRGLIAIAFAIFNGNDAKTISQINEKSVFEKIGLEEHLTPQRSNGLRSLVERLRALAKN